MDHFWGAFGDDVTEAFRDIFGTFFRMVLGTLFGTLGTLFGTLGMLFGMLLCTPIGTLYGHSFLTSILTFFDIYFDTVKLGDKKQIGVKKPFSVTNCLFTL